MPIHHHPQTHEPYIPLPHPLTNIILTPPRPCPNPTDAAVLTSLLNDPRVYRFLENPPYPYLASHAETFLRETRAEAERILADAEAGGFVDGCPFRCIRIREVTRTREVKRDGDLEGDDVLIGDIGIARYAFYEFRAGSEERREAVERNRGLGVGSGEIVWGVGNFLSPSYHGRGIMTAVVRTLIDEWAVPRMNARIIKASAYVGNAASVRVFEKNGFQMEHTLEDWAVIPENRGGGRKSIHVLGWKAPE